MPDELTAERFAACKGQSFILRYGEHPPIPAELIEVSENPRSRQSSDTRMPFTLVFRGPKGSYIPQQIVEVSHEQLGVLGIFLVPIGSDEHGMRYEAVFN